MRETLASYFRLLWRQYDYQLILVSASLAGLVIEASLSAKWSPWRIGPPALVAVCLLYFLLNAYSIHQSLFPNPALAYAVCTGKTLEWFESSARRQQEERLKQSGIRWSAVQREFRIHVSDWAFVDQSALTEDSETWVNLTRRMLVHFWHLPKRVEGVPVYHFFLIAPPTVSFALGAHAGRRVAHVVYHFVNSTKQPYLPVADTTKRDHSQGLDLLNRRVAEANFQYIQVNREKRNRAGTKVLLVLDFTNHKLAGSLPQEAEAQTIVRVANKNGIGHLPNNTWEQLAQEIASVILEVCDQGLGMDVYVNTPLALAFMVGSIVGPIKGITLCEHNVYLQKPIRCFGLADARIQELSSPLVLAKANDLPAPGTPPSS